MPKRRPISAKRIRKIDQAATSDPTFSPSQKNDRRFKDAFDQGLRFATLADWRRASDCFRKCVLLDERHTPSWLNLALALATVGDHGKAMEIAERVRAILPAGDQLLVAYAEVCTIAGKPDRALVASAELLAQDPTDRHAYVVRAEAFKVLKDPDGVLSSVIKARELGEEVNPRLAITAGDAWVEKGELDNGLTEYEAAIASSGRLSHLPASRHALISAWKGKGRALLLKNSSTRDIKGLRIAIQTLKHAVQLDSDDSNTRAMLAHVLRRAGNPSEALRCIAQTRDVTTSKLLLERALSLLDLGRGEEAAPILSEILRHPDLAPLAREQALEHLPMALLQKGDPEGCIAACDTAAKAGLEGPMILNFRVAAWVLLKQQDKAIQCLQEAYITYPDDAVISANLGYFLVRKGGEKEGRDLIQKALEKERRNPGLWALQYRVYLEARDDTQANLTLAAARIEFEGDDDLLRQLDRHAQEALKDELYYVRTQVKDLESSANLGRDGVNIHGANSSVSTMADSNVVPSQTISTSGGPVLDVGIVIALKEEFREFLVEIQAKCRVEHDTETCSYYYLFEHHGYRCVVTLIGEMGEKAAALTTERMLTKWNLNTVVMLGIAAGIHDDLRVGDVVVATQIDSYLDSGKAEQTKGDKNHFSLAPGGEVYRGLRELINPIRNLEFTHAHSTHRDRPIHRIVTAQSIAS